MEWRPIRFLKPYRSKIERELGFSMPPLGQDMPEDSEVQFSRVVAEAAQRLTDAAKAKQAQEEAKQLEEDPNFQLRREEVAVKRLQAESRAKNDAIKTQLSALGKMGDLDAKEKDRLVDIIKVILGAEADQVDITNRAQAAELQATLSLLQTMIAGAGQADKLEIDRSKSNK